MGKGVNRNIREIVLNIGSIKLDTLLCNNGLLRMKQLFSVSINVSQDAVSARL